MSLMKVQLLLTGNELMSGDIVDSNSAMIAQQLKEIGLEVKRKVTVSDDLDLLVEELKHISQHSDVLIVNGGLGPTIDDMTAQALAKAAGVDLVEHPDALEHLKSWCEYRRFPMSAQNLKQTILPQGCDVIANPIGSAVGFKLIVNDCAIYCTPGVPPELKMMMREQIIPALNSQLPENISHHVTRLQSFGLGESTIQKLIDEQMPDWPSAIELGFRASMPLMEVKLTTRSKEALAEQLVWQEKLINMLGAHYFNTVSDKPLQLADMVLSALNEKQLTLTTAESCTGGLIASEITKISGASSVFEAGFVTYSNSIKEKLVAVDSAILNEHGAVSEQCVKAMVRGAIATSGADIGVAVSGIAGPNGGSEQKPVGTVWIAWGSAENLKTTCLLITGHRQYFQHSVANIALDLVRRFLIGNEEIPHYVETRAVKN